ncbi:DUF885 family protein [Methylocystis sp. Sn-Cys]|uniref:DUF885 domain-containing protein n=1 Tax=Methylocystis sp. Sn-Cys TaxID=1701263 RepID=UPI001923508E|nr:DUF885 family protein [Methylocystis sp. Sn-Cys]MBL1257862.1 DUF885 family protein [Methylocystis sp. Sn-Cys]
MATEGAKLGALFDKFVQERLRRYPEHATSLGLDKGELAGLKSLLSERSPNVLAQDKEDTARRLEGLRSIDRAALGDTDRINYDTVLLTTEIRNEADRIFNFGAGGSGAPYVLSQLTGAYRFVPDFLDTKHTIETSDDAEAYLARLDAFARQMREELELAKHDVGAGVTPPDFVIDKTLVQMRAFLNIPVDKATVVQSLARRTKVKGIAGDWVGRAEAAYTGKILPALASQAEYLQSLRGRATHAAGVAALPNGADYYRVSLKESTTSTLTPDEIHATGLELVAKISSELGELLESQGYSSGNVGQRLAELSADPKFLYENTDDAKETLIADLNAKVAEVQAKLPSYFGALPKAIVEIRRVPKEIEAGAPGGYYYAGSLDGARPGAYYINLRDTAEWARWRLPTLTYHEAIPGHHLQITLANEAQNLPLIRKMSGFNAYAEGWALYAEQLAVEIGLYENDPLGHIGQLQAALFRAVRLVVDSGLHAKDWSRERAIAYFADTLGEKQSVATTEVERYCVWPGQACGYMVGKLTWLRLRDRARLALGSRFDLRKFHDAGLLSGSLPLAVLERVVEDYSAR